MFFTFYFLFPLRGHEYGSWSVISFGVPVVMNRDISFSVREVNSCIIIPCLYIHICGGGYLPGVFLHSVGPNPGSISS